MDLLIIKHLHDNIKNVISYVAQRFEHMKMPVIKNVQSKTSQCIIRDMIYYSQRAM